MLARMKADGLENVRGEPVMVPHWVRGAESAALVVAAPQAHHDARTRRSVGTPAAGITAPVLVVTSFDELTRRAAEAKGKIVLFDVPFTTLRTRRVRVPRRAAPSAAAKVGAVAMLLRSVAPYSHRTRRTPAALRYDSTAAKIPAAAVTVEDAR